MNYKNMRGFSLTDFVLFLIIIGTLLFFGMKLFPMYRGYYAVRSAVSQITPPPSSAEYAGAEYIQKQIFQALNMEAVDHVKPENVIIRKKSNGWQIVVDYEVRTPLIGRLDVVGKFDVERDVNSGGR